MNLLFSWGGALIDVFALLLIFGITYLGAKQGFIKSLISMFGTIFSLLFAVLLCGAIARSLEKTHGTITSVSNWLNGIISRIFGSNLMNTTLEEASSDSFEGSPLSLLLVKIVLSIKQGSDVPATVTLSQVICPTFAYYIVCILSLTCAYFIFKMIFFIIADITKLAHKVKVVGNTDKVLGAVFGFVKSLVIIDLILLCVGAIPLRLTQVINHKVESSCLVSFLQDVNLIRIIFEALFRNGATNFIKSIF